jgi:uncharacterized protein
LSVVRVHNEHMASNDLMRLLKLHEVDAEIVSIKAQASSMEGGKKLAAELKQLELMLEQASQAYHSVHGEQSDLELSIKSIEDKIAKFDKDLFSGKIVSPKEIENIQKEIKHLKEVKSGHEDRVLELMELVPPAKDRFDRITKAVGVKTRELAAWKKEAVAKREVLEVRYRELNTVRPTLTSAVPAPLLAKYESIRQKHHGIGMAYVTKENTCGECGTMVPEMSLSALRDDQVKVCESCHRILYLRHGVVF